MIGTCETCRFWRPESYRKGRVCLGVCDNRVSGARHTYETMPEDTCIRYEPKAGTRKSVVDELKALGVSEPTEEERFLRREEDKTRRWLRKTDIKGEGGTEHG